MRWLLIHPGPNFSVADVYNGWAEALKDAGEQVAEYNLDRRLSFYDSLLIDTGTQDADGHQQVRKAVTRDQAIGLAAAGLFAAAYQVLPDVILATSAFFTPPGVLEVLRARGHKIIMLFTETPYQTGQQLEMAKYADICLLNDPEGIGEYRAVSPIAVHMPHAYRPSVHHPGPADPAVECDLAFVGTGYPSRIAFFEAMDLGGLDVLLAGNWQALDKASPLLPLVAHDLQECTDNEQAAGIYRSARCGINVYRREAEPGREGQGWAVGPREIEMAACGLFYLREPRGEGDELLPMLPSFTTPGQASGLVRWYLAHPAARKVRAAAAREAVADRTFGNNVKSLLRLLDRQPVKIH